MPVANLPVDTAHVERAFALLIGLQLKKCTKIFATCSFHLYPAESSPEDDGRYMLDLECPWRIERHSGIVVGFHDYVTPAHDNLDPGWDPNSQSGSLQDERLRDLLGDKTKDRDIVGAGLPLVVEGIQSDSFGGFRLALSGGFTLSVFPSSLGQMEWMIRRRGGDFLGLMHGKVQGVLGAACL